MKFSRLSRWRRAVVLGVVTVPGFAPAQNPEPLPFTPPERNARDIEILYGTRKVGPIYRPVPIPVVPGESKGWSGAPPAPVAPPPAPREEPKPVIESRTIILAGYVGPFASQQPSFYPSDMPWLAAPRQAAPLPPSPLQIPAAPAPAPAQQQPTVVVIREGAGSEPRPAPAEAARGITLGNEAILGIGIGLAGLGFGYAGFRRRTATAAEMKQHPAPPSPVASDGVMLMGKYNAGPVPATAEKFDLGPSYAAQLREKKKIEEQGQTAVLEFILNQNLALHAQLAGPDDELPEAAEIDPDHA